MPPSDDAPADRWHVRLMVLGMVLAAVLLGAFFYLYGNDLLNFLILLSGPPRLPGS